MFEVENIKNFTRIAEWYEIKMGLDFQGLELESWREETTRKVLGGKHTDAHYFGGLHYWDTWCRLTKQKQK